MDKPLLAGVEDKPDASAPKVETPKPEAAPKKDEPKVEAAPKPEAAPKKDEPKAEALKAPETKPLTFEEIVAPEGSNLDDDHVKAFIEKAKALGLTPAQARDLVARDAEVLKSQREGFEADAQRVVAEWTEKAKADPEVGGPALAESVRLANAALDKFATPEFAAELRNSGWGSNPEVLRTFRRVGAALLREGSHVAGVRAPEPAKKDPLDVMFPSMAAKE